MSLRYGDLTWDPNEPANQQAQQDLAGMSSVKPRGGRSLRNERLPMVQLDGVAVHAITEEQCIDYVLNELRAGRGGTVVTPNLDHLRRCKTDLNFGALIAEADVVVADGMPLVWASRLQGTPLPQRVAGSDLVSSLSAAAARENRTLFFLGGSPGTADGAAQVLRQRHPNIQIVGTYCPPVGFEKSNQQMASIVNAILRTAPDLIYVCLGSPKQEKLIQQIRPTAPNAWWLGLGNSFSFLCGDVRRAPHWMQRLGIEWIHRLFQEPRRLFKRYIVQGVPFAARLLGKSAIRGTPIIGNLVVSDPATHDAGTPIPDDLAAAAAPIARATTVERPVEKPSQPTTRPVVKGGGVDLGRLRALILLGGTVRPTPLTTHIGRSVLDLPLTQDQTLLQSWVEQARQLGQRINLPELPVRVLVNRGTADPTSGASCGYPALHVERDYAEYRGTGGVLCDVAMNYADDDLILVANAAQLLLDPLHHLASALSESRGQVCLISHHDGTPSGLMLITRGALRLIPHAGFVDMKEQALPMIAGRYDVTVVRRRRPSGLPIRSLTEYIFALRYQHRHGEGRIAGADPLDEQWQPAFSIVEPGAKVDPSASIHDSVVLNGATVENSAVLVRSLACPKAVVRHDRKVVDAFCTSADGRKRKGA